MQNFDQWLKARATARGKNDASALPPLGERGVTIDMLMVWIALPGGVLSIVGVLLFERYSTLRDALQMGGGLLAAVMAVMGLILLAYAAIAMVPTRWKLSLPLLFLIGCMGFVLADLEMRQRTLDREARERGEYVEAIERAKARGDWRE